VKSQFVKVSTEREEKQTMNIWNKTWKSLIAFALSFTTIFSMNVSVRAAEPVNVARGATAIASSIEADSVAAANAVDGDTSSRSSRWGSAVGNGPHWIYFDLGEVKNLKCVRIFWENRKAQSYKIEKASGNPENDASWSTVIERTRPTSTTDIIDFNEVVSTRYIRLYISSHTSADPDGGVDWNSISIYEFEAYEENLSIPNVALNASATASGVEASTLSADKVTDGNTTSTRWASSINLGPHWIYLDFGSVKSIKTLKIFWETRKATGYRIEKASANPENDASWSTVVERNRPASKVESIIFDEAVDTQYLRIYIPTITNEDPDGGAAWSTISIYEIEAYEGLLPLSLEEAMNLIEVTTPAKGDTKFAYKLPDVSKYNYQIEYNGTDFEQVIDAEGNIYQPVMDKTVKISFKGTDEDGNYKFKEFDITVPGKYSPSDSQNDAPLILPELQEWKGNTGTFTMAANAKVVYADDALKATAETFAQDYYDLTGKTMSVAKGSAANAGEILLSLTTDKTKGLQDEGYLMEINDKVTVEAETTTGAFWATRTILQSIKLTGNIPCGITRDYPLYKVRGYILDVGRKTFTMDHLEQMVKLMSWYKMNDFQIHLNDNLIPLENLGTEDKIMQAYSAFRLESDIKKGGNNGLNQADLTSTDVFYTKDEFRNLIKESRTYGVNIVPEIDTPAHSLALTKVRPDLRHGLSGRENDHLNLTTKYSDSLAFVQSIFQEYMSGSNPVFDSATTVHVGADEYTADGNAYRRFANDMLKFVSDSGRKARIWGSLTSIKGNVEVRGEGVEMNLWNGGWANMKEMYDLGFELINCNDGQYYIVPNAGYYYDYLNNSTVYNDPINRIGGNYVPAGDEQMLGGAFAVWNDMTDYLENGVSEYDIYDRIKTSTSLFGAKLWGKGSMTQAQAEEASNLLGDAPNTNFGYDVDSKEDAIANYPMDTMSDATSNAKDLTAGKNAAITSVDGKNALELKGGESYVNTKYTTIGLQNDLRVKVKRTSESTEEQVLFESAYGTIKAVQKGTGKVGFTRENRDYSFSYTLPVNEWVELEFKNERNVAKLYVNGTLVDTLGDGEQVEGRPLLATTMFPFARIGSTTNSFIGYVDDVRIGKNATFNSTMTLDHAIISANKVLAEHENEELKNVIAEAKEVLKKYAPTAAEVKTYTDQINELLKAIDYEKADYSRVDHYLDIVPEDLTPFTQESVDNLNLVIASIQKDLPISMQDTVDGYEKALAQALQELTLVEYVNPNYVETTKMTASASSHQDNSSAPDKVLDGDPTTMWHSKWSYTDAAHLPHWIMFELDVPTAIEGLVYTPRSGAGNGTISQYRIEISDDGTNWTTVADGNWEMTDGNKIAAFNKVTTKYVKLVAVAAKNNNASAAEIRLMKGDVIPDLDGLNAIITSAEEKLLCDQYSDESLAALAEAVASAKNIASNPDSDANDVEIAKRDLYEKIGRLVLKEKPKPANKLSLESAIERADAITEDDLANVVSENAIKEFKDALAEAKTILANDKATQEEVDASVNRLSDAMHQLTVNQIGDKSELQKLVNSVANKKQSDYTAASWSVFAEALSNANQVLANAKATQSLIDDAYHALASANDGLAKVDDPSKPVDPDKPTDPDKPNNEFIYSLEHKDSGVSVIGKFPLGIDLIVDVLESKPIRELIDLIKDKSIVKKYNFEKVYDIYMVKNGVVYQHDGTFQVKIKLDKELQDKALKILYITDDGKVTEIKSTVRDGYIIFSTNHNSYYAIVSDKTGGSPITNTGTEPITSGCFAIILVGGMMLLFTKKMEDVLD